MLLWLLCWLIPLKWFGGHQYAQISNSRKQKSLNHLHTVKSLILSSLRSDMFMFCDWETPTYEFLCGRASWSHLHYNTAATEADLNEGDWTQTLKHTLMMFYIYAIKLLSCWIESVPSLNPWWHDFLKFVGYSYMRLLLKLVFCNFRDKAT